MAVSDQIRTVMESAGLTVDEFAGRLDEKPQRIKDVLRGKQRAPEDLLVKLVEIFCVDANWLLTGKGAAPSLAPAEAVLLDRYRASTPDVRAAALRMLGTEPLSVRPSRGVSGSGDLPGRKFTPPEVRDGGSIAPVKRRGGKG